MAVVKMTRLSLIALKSDRERLLRELFWLSSVDVTPLTSASREIADLSCGEADTELSSDAAIREADAQKNRIAAISSAIDLLTPMSGKKGGLFTPKEKETREGMEKLSARSEALYAEVYHVNDLKTENIRLQNNINRLESRIASLKPWIDHSLPLSLSETASTLIFTGTLPTDRYKEACETGEEGGLYIEEVGQAADKTAIFAVCAKTDAVKAAALLSSVKFNASPFKDIDKTAKEAIIDFEAEISTCKAHIEDNTADLKNAAQTSLKAMQKLYDTEVNALKLLQVRERLLKTDSCILMGGFFPSDKTPELEKALSPFDVYYTLSEPDEKDDPPVLLKNNTVVTPFESITAMYALPVYGGLDPNFAVAPFYFLLFGMMLSDAGYGLIMAIACFLGLLLLKPSKSMKNTMKLFMFCGISTVFWGFMFGTFFGNSVAVVATTFFSSDVTLKPLWFDPVSDPMTLLIFSVIIGYVQILTSLVLKAVVAIRKKDYLTAFCDSGFWIIVLLGAGMIALSLAIPGIIGTIGAYVCIAGAVGLILTQGRDKKGIIGKLFGGILSLYDVTGYLSDLLSYSRILALGLSSGVIGQVFNTMASLGGGNIVGLIFFILIFIVGHLLNFALSFLSAYVHASRLQFIEFFGRFYESGGRPYEAFSAGGKYVDVITENELK